MLSIFCVSCTFAQFGDDVPPNAESGKCYAKSMIIAAPEELTETYPIYIGSDLKAPGLKTITIIYEEAHYEWVDKKSTTGQTVHCLQKVPDLTEDLIIVKDTTGRSDYIFETFTFYQYYPERNHTEWREVVCNNRIDARLVDDLQRALSKRGFYQGELSGRIDKATKEALVKYQRAKYLPTGNLDTETLDSLDVFHY